MVVRQTRSEDLLSSGIRTELRLELANEREIDVLLIDNQPIQFDKRNLGRHGIETLLD